MRRVNVVQMDRRALAQKESSDKRKQKNAVHANKPNPLWNYVSHLFCKSCTQPQEAEHIKKRPVGRPPKNSIWNADTGVYDLIQAPEERRAAASGLAGAAPASVPAGPAPASVPAVASASARVPAAASLPRTASTKTFEKTFECCCAQCKTKLRFKVNVCATAATVVKTKCASCQTELRVTVGKQKQQHDNGQN